MSILGNRLLRKEDPELLTTGARYTADVDDPRLQGAAHVSFVRSTEAHARVNSIDVAAALEAPGVVAAFTAADIDIDPPPLVIPPLFPEEMRRPWLASGVVRFVGEPIAIVVTDHPHQGEDAAELVFVDYEPLPVITAAEQAMEEETLLFPEFGSNISVSYGDGGDPDLFAGCEVVVEQRIVNQRLAACPLEVRSTAAVWDGETLVMWSSNQNPHNSRNRLAGIYGIDREYVRFICPDVGGGFGPKINQYPEDMILPWVARRIGRAVRWTETRTENMVAMGHGRDQLNIATIGGSRTGDLQAYRLVTIANVGAYPSLGAFMPSQTASMAPGVYQFDRVETRGVAVVTNTTPTEAYRGAGRPEASEAIERIVDVFAAEIGMDPSELRRQNLISPDAFPYETGTGLLYDCGDYEKALDLVLAEADYPALRAEQRRRRRSGETVQLGIGLCTYVEITAGPFPGSEFAEVRVHEDGSATVYSGTSPHGQGHETSWSMIVADELGIPVDRIRVVTGDTEEVAKGSGTYGSRSLQLGGAAVKKAAAELAEYARSLAAELLGAEPVEVVLDKAEGASFHVAGSRTRAKGWAELAQAAASSGGLDAAASFKASQPTFPFGAHLAVVEVDVETGAVHLTRFVSCDDSGRLLNPLIAEGQRHGGIAQGVAQALLEEMVYDEAGNPLTTNLADYAMISATELPSFDLVALETPTPVNPLGAKGIGEAGTIGATPAVHNAVCDALAVFGVRHLDMPLTAEKVWAAIKASTAGEVPS
ncbi:MAG: Carbon monoxide dehydrogenase large chain [Acidimicrobiales bacterium]|nr:MAG: xanthine dehydrogenase family protein molybdopterin-binding subunit [Actinomycetota bacterium]MBV6507765.1 Carbon monoxide dehydrogenase large chain [Acidimicrobiales bacterium]RIK05924.1 MAG: carbon monoxide dehydrogenase [Acidobacteriota bacterium]